MGKEFLDEPSAISIYKKMKKNGFPLEKNKKLKLQNKEKVNNKKNIKNSNVAKSTGVKEKKIKKNKIKKNLIKKSLNNIDELEKVKNKIIKTNLAKKSLNNSTENLVETSLKVSEKNESSKLQKKTKKSKLIWNGNENESKSKRNEIKVFEKNNLNLLNEAPKNNSVQEGFKLFEKILKPFAVNKFFEEFWEKSHCYIQKRNSDFFKNLISFEIIDRMLRQHHIEYTKNIDITYYENDIRETVNPDGRALPADVWAFYNEGHSIRLLNPQTFLPGIYTMNTILQEYFHCMVGANVYLTPPNSQGFAPHYDDIEAFVLQVEGKKRWRLYEPRANEQLPRYSSKNFKPDEIGKPIFDKVIEAGDVLYFPRGVIHQACTEPGSHSLHITLSVYQKNSFADLFEHLLPITLSKSIENNIRLRRGLPLSLWRNFGKVNFNRKSKERMEVITNIKMILKEMVNHLRIDEAVDQLAKKYQHDALPPILTQEELIRTAFGNNTYINNTGLANTNVKIELETKVRLLRANILRVVYEENVYRIYFYVDNSREYHEYDANFIEMESFSMPLIQKLIQTYPNYIKVSDLPLNENEYKISIVQLLWDRGLLIKENPNI